MGVQTIKYREQTTASKPQNLVVVIAATGVRQPLAINTPCYEAFVQIDQSAGQPVYVGGDNVSVANGIQIDPPAAGVTPDGVQDYTDNLNKIFIIGTIGTIVRVYYWTAP